ncbi:phage major capsid protein, partial [Pseudomonas soli]|uniref:phage major capsid protein n=2 Tax=Bacteria TaxID=2 RepID=UPI003D0171EB
LDVPYVISEFAPNTFTNGLYSGMIGDFSYYWIAEAVNLEIQRLVELYAESNQVGFIGRQEADAMPVLAEAFVRIKCATS